jgi:hypothetical protein
MNLEKLVIKVLGLVMLSYFFFDSWKKYELASQSEGEILKIKFQQFQYFLANHSIYLPP